MNGANDILSINSLLMDRVRLSILATLAVEKGPLDFNAMLKKLNLTKGNFSRHAQKLEEDALIKITKRFVGNKPVTTYECTGKGEKELKDYLSKMEEIIKLVEIG
jgi:DNA-binding transcriptional ArsR family regulator